MDLKTIRVFPAVITAVLLVLIGGNLALQLSLAGTRFLPRLNSDELVLARSTAPVGDGSRRLARTVVVVILDGMRVRESIGLPTLDRLRRAGIEATASSHYPTFSRPNYVSIVTGVPPVASGVRSNQYDQPVYLDSLMDRSRAAGLRSGIVSDYSPALAVMFTRPATPVERARDPDMAEYVSEFDDMNYVVWPGGLVNAARHLIAQRYPLIILHLGLADAVGHDEGGDSPEYADAVRTVDRDLGLALRGLDLDRDAIIVTADHGHTDAGGHGGLEPEVVEVPLILAGAGIRKGTALAGATGDATGFTSDATGVRLIDIAPTAAALLGLPPPADGLGRTLTDALDLPDDQRATIADRDRTRVDRNRQLVEQAQDAARDRIAARRIWRLPIVGLLFALGVAAMLYARRWEVWRLDWRVLAVTLPTFPATYYLIMAILGQRYSPSFAPERGDISVTFMQWGVPAVAAHIVVSWLALRGRVVLKQRLAAANALTALGLMIALAPAGLAWALFPGPHAEVPGPALLVLVPASLIAAGFYAGASAITLGLEIVIFFSRAIDPRHRLARLERAAEKERQRLSSMTD